MKNTTPTYVFGNVASQKLGIPQARLKTLAEAGLISSLKPTPTSVRKYDPSVVARQLAAMARKGQVSVKSLKEPTLVEVKPAESKVEAIAPAALGEAPDRPSLDENFDQGIVMYVKSFPQSIINEYVSAGFWVRVQNSMAVLYSRSEMTAEDAAMALSAVLCEDGGWRDGFVVSLTRWSNMSLVPLTKLRSRLQSWLERGVVEEDQSIAAHPANLGDDRPRLFRFKRPGHQTAEWRNYGA